MALEVRKGLKKPVYIPEGDEHRIGYSLQVLKDNGKLDKEIRFTQNVLLHNYDIFQGTYGVFKNKKGQRMRYYVWEHMIHYFNEELKKHKCKHYGKGGFND